MTSYVWELVMVLVVMFGIIIGLDFAIKTVFRELTEYKKKQNEPYEKSLNTLLDTISDGTKMMFKFMNKTMEEDMDRWKK